MIDHWSQILTVLISLYIYKNIIKENGIREEKKKLKAKK